MSSVLSSQFAPEIFGLICNCSGAMPKIREFLASSHVPNYMRVPVYQGDAAKREAETQKLAEITAYFNKVSAYTIIVLLYPDGSYEWADVNNLSVFNRVRAEAMLEHFVSSL